MHAVSWLLRNRAPYLATGISFTANQTLRLFAGVLIAYTAVRVAQYRGLWIAFATFLSVAAVGWLGMALMILGAAVLAWRRGELREHS